jgi:hypothetical protein
MSKGRLTRASDKFQQLAQAERQARRKIIKAGYADLLVNGFNVVPYENEELRIMGEQVGKWAGQYQRNSLENDPNGLTIYIAVDEHPGPYEMLTTLLHEAGHALWELLDKEAIVEWQHVCADDTSAYDAEETFADDFMWLCLDQKRLMSHETDFIALTAVA